MWEGRSGGWGQGWLLHRTPRRPKPKKLFNESKDMAAAIYLHKTEHFLQRKWKKVSQGCCIAAGRRPQRRKLFRAHRWLAINGDLESVTASIFLFPAFLKCLGVMFLSLCLCFYLLLSPWVCWAAMIYFFVCVFVLSVFFHIHGYFIYLSLHQPTYMCVNLFVQLVFIFFLRNSLPAPQKWLHPPFVRCQTNITLKKYPCVVKQI